mmetsp:Transcript_145251/g.253508  ORF Transcript_145251/g.253508 Transcript_145251/m.253508 type:complete len:113 (+) Transcript_145251:586-924(+)
MRGPVVCNGTQESSGFKIHVSDLVPPSPSPPWSTAWPSRDHGTQTCEERTDGDSEDVVFLNLCHWPQLERQPWGPAGTIFTSNHQASPSSTPALLAPPKTNMLQFLLPRKAE